MAFQVSPGINVSEIDLTTIVPAVATTQGALGGVFRWGPIGQPILIDSEVSLVNRFGKPTNFNAETWFTAASFLAYGNQLYISRAANTTSTNVAIGTWTSVAYNGSAPTANTLVSATFNVTNQDDYDTKLAANSFATANASVLFIARYPGIVGDSLKVSMIDTVNAYSSNLASVSTVNVASNGQVTINFSGSSFTEANAAYQTLSNTDIIRVGNSILGFQYLKLTSRGTQPSGNVITATTADQYQLSSNATVGGSVQRYWEYFSAVTSAPGTSSYTTSFGNTSAVDEVHLVVADDQGKFTGVPGTILEVYQGLSRAVDAKTSDGSTNYYVNVVNQTSKYARFTWHRGGASYVSNSISIASVTNYTPLVLDFSNGNDGVDELSSDTSLLSAVQKSYDQFTSTENVDISLVMCGKAIGTNGTQVATYVIDNVVEQRKDCVAFISPQRSDVVNNVGSEYSSVVSFRKNLNRSTSYAFLDSGYKYMYDKYNDLYRYIPLNGDIAGLCVSTDLQRDPWWSPAGFNRGQIKNIVKLAYNPPKAERDVLYPAGINPVATFPGQGTVLFGDKTLQTKPSAFDRINVRRLFIVLEKAIATASKYTLFEFNDAFTRAQFVSLVTPFLKDVQGRRGIYDFRVVCDESNNTGEVIDGNRFVGDIYIKPARSINFIQLNFVAVRTGVEFSEIVGKF